MGLPTTVGKIMGKYTLLVEAGLALLALAIVAVAVAVSDQRGELLFALAWGLLLGAVVMGLASLGRLWENRRIARREAQRG